MADSLLTLFRRNALTLGEKPCLHFKTEKGWQHLSWVDTEEKIRRYSLGLMGAKVVKGKSVAIWGHTVLEWTLLDMSVMAAGGIVVPIYATLQKSQVSYILKDSNVSIFFVQNPDWMAGLEDVIRSKKIEVIFFGEAERRLLELGKNIPVNAYDEQINSISLTDVATIVYTSGTTGLPKGVVLTHQNIMGEVQSLQQVFDLPSDHIALTALPLAHILARGLQFYLLAQGVQTAFAENLESLAKNFLEIRPHFFVGVPRIFEKVYERTMAQVDRSPRSIKNFLVESLTVACRLVENPKKGTISWKERLQVLMAQSLVFRRLKKRMGGR